MEGTFLFPDYDGGAEWGGQAFDPETGLYYVNANEMAWTVGLDEVDSSPRPASSTLYRNSREDCHGADLAGVADFPGLANLAETSTAEAVAGMIRDGSGRMPGFGHLGEPTVSAIPDYLMTGEDLLVDIGDSVSPYDLPYRHDGYDRFFDIDGYPAIKPPWGALNAINVDTGEIEWKIPLGEYPALVEQGITNTGSENYGGPIVTQNGLSTTTRFEPSTRRTANFRGRRHCFTPAPLHLPCTSSTDASSSSSRPADRKSVV